MGFWVWGLEGLGFRDLGFGSRILGVGPRVQGLGLRVLDAGYAARDSRLRVEKCLFVFENTWVWSLGFRK